MVLKLVECVCKLFVNILCVSLGALQRTMSAFSANVWQSCVFPLQKMRNMSGTVILMKHVSVQNACVFPLTIH